MYFVSSGTWLREERWGVNPAIYRIWYTFRALILSVYLGISALYIFPAWCVDHPVTASRFLPGRALRQVVRLVTPLYRFVTELRGIRVVGFPLHAWI